MNEKKAQTQIEVGVRVGKLTVLERTEERRNGYVVWRCRCDCGGEICLDTRYLKRGAVRDCGCSGLRGMQRDLRGRRFGRLVCLEPTRERGNSGGVIWRCRCDCGNECLAVGIQLTQGYKKSCGCLYGPNPEEFLGQRFGALLVTGYAGKQNGSHMWNCLCDCGRTTVASQINLRNGHTKSCGCRRCETQRKNLKFVDGTSVVMIENRMKRPIKSNTSGVSGVYYSSKRGKWHAQITFQGKTHYLGTFDDIDDAIRARKRGEEMYNAFLEAYYASAPDDPMGDTGEKTPKDTESGNAKCSTVKELENV